MTVSPFLTRPPLKSQPVKFRTQIIYKQTLARRKSLWPQQWAAVSDSDALRRLDALAAEGKVVLDGEDIYAV